MQYARTGSTKEFSLKRKKVIKLDDLFINKIKNTFIESFLGSLQVC